MPILFLKGAHRIDKETALLLSSLLWCNSVHINLCCGMKKLQHFLFDFFFFLYVLVVVLILYRFLKKGHDCSATSEPTDREHVYVYINIKVNLQFCMGGFDKKKLPHVNTTEQEPTLYLAYRC